MAAKTERRTVPDARFRAEAPADAADAASPRKLVGYAAVFNVWTTLYESPSLVVREIIRPGAFKAAIADGQDVRALVDHDSCLILGRTRAGTLALVEDEVGLRCEITLPDTQAARDVHENVKVGNLSQMSFAFLPKDGGETVTTVRTEGGPTTESIEIKACDLFDVSVVTYPAYQSTSVEVRRERFERESAERRRALASSRARLDQLLSSKVKTSG